MNQRNKETEFYVMVNYMFRSSQDSIFASLGCIINNAIATHAKDNYFTAVLYKNLLLQLLKINLESDYTFLPEETCKTLKNWFSDPDEELLQMYKKVEFVKIF